MMDKLKGLLDRNVTALCERERYFTAAFLAARNLLDRAHAHDAGLAFPSGEVCGPQGCSCGDRGCLHAVAWKIYTYKG